MSQAEINKLKNDSKKLELARKLLTNEGFYSYWFNLLAHPGNEDKTKQQIFEFVNNQYKIVFNAEAGKYSSYKSFQNTSNRLTRKKRK